MTRTYHSDILGMALDFDRAKDEEETMSRIAKISLDLIADDFEEIVKNSKIIINRETTIMITPEGDKVICRPSKGEVYDKETGIAMCIAKYLFGSRREFLKFVDKAKEQTPDRSETL